MTDQEAFSKIMEFTFEWEGRGKLHKVSGDAGGWTKWGIASAYHPNVDVPNLTKERAMEIYYDDYWLRYKCHEKPYPSNVVCFEMAVNPGPRVLYLVPPGYDWKDLVIYRLDYYMDRIAENPEKVKFAQGWDNRTMDLYLKILRDEL